MIFKRKFKEEWAKKTSGINGGVKDGVKLTINQEKIFKKIKETPDITAEELSRFVGINKRNIEKNLSTGCNKTKIIP